MPKNRWLMFGLVALATTLFASQFVFFHDIFTLALLFPAIAILGVSRSRQAFALAGVFIAVALYWSSRDTDSCSAVWRTKFVVDKALGRLEYSSWPQVLRAAATFEQCPVARGAEIVELGQDTVDGHVLTKYSSPMGEFWLPESSASTLEWLVWEITDYKVYGGGANSVREGDVVIDAGAHVGVFTRYALDNGASRVISIEPNPANILCLKRNFADEIAAGRVTIVEEGVWDEVSELELSLDAHDTARPTLHVLPGGRADFIVVAGSSAGRYAGRARRRAGGFHQDGHRRGRARGAARRAAHHRGQLAAHGHLHLPSRQRSGGGAESRLGRQPDVSHRLEGVADQPRSDPPQSAVLLLAERLEAAPGESSCWRARLRALGSRPWDATFEGGR